MTPLCLGMHSVPGDEASERVLLGDSQVRLSLLAAMHFVWGLPRR